MWARRAYDGFTLLGVYSSPIRADSLLNTADDTRTVRFIGICRCIGIRQIARARRNFYLAVRVSGIPRQTSMDSQDRSYARPIG
jgi:hypothetical protein